MISTIDPRCRFEIVDGASFEGVLHEPPQERPRHELVEVIQANLNDTALRICLRSTRIQRDREGRRIKVSFPHRLLWVVAEGSALDVAEELIRRTDAQPRIGWLGQLKGTLPRLPSSFVPQHLVSFVMTYDVEGSGPDLTLDHQVFPEIFDNLSDAERKAINAAAQQSEQVLGAVIHLVHEDRLKTLLQRRARMEREALLIQQQNERAARQILQKFDALDH